MIGPYQLAALFILVSGGVLFAVQAWRAARQTALNASVVSRVDALELAHRSMSEQFGERLGSAHSTTTERLDGLAGRVAGVEEVAASAKRIAGRRDSKKKTPADETAPLLAALAAQHASPDPVPSTHAQTFVPGRPLLGGVAPPSAPPAEPANGLPPGKEIVGIDD